MKEVAPRVGQEESQKFSILGLSHDPKGMTATCGNPRHIAHHVPAFQAPTNPAGDGKPGRAA